MVEGASVHLDVIICTHNRAAALGDVLEGLAAQQEPVAMSWSILVVDNASSDSTTTMVQRHAARDPNLRYVFEPTLGLTPARLRGVAETTGKWLAFVDDDNLLAPGWLRAIEAAIESRPRAGGIGGRVVLDWATPPPRAAAEFGFCFAEQDLGDEPRQMYTLVGAGLVLRRDALEACGWTERPLLADRAGQSLISGGDVEIALRIRSAGYELWYAPDAVMRHRMPPARATLRYLLRMCRALGATAAVVALLGWAGDFPAWRKSVHGNAHQQFHDALRRLRSSVRRPHRLASALGWLAMAIGYREGVRQVERMTPQAREAIQGKAITPPLPDG